MANDEVQAERVFQINLLSIFQSNNLFSWDFYFSLLIPGICLLIALYNAMRLRPPNSCPLDGRYDFEANMYQQFESHLVDNNKIKKEVMMAYYAQYSWGRMLQLLWRQCSSVCPSLFWKHRDYTHFNIRHLDGGTTSGHGGDMFGGFRSDTQELTNSTNPQR